MKVRILTPKTLPRNYLGLGLTKKTWEELNSGKVVEVDSIPGEYKNKVEEVKETTTSPTSTGSKASIKGGKK
jgi:hypothetical protein